MIFKEKNRFSKEEFLKEIKEDNKMPSGSAYDLSTNGGLPELTKYYKKSWEKN